MTPYSLVADFQHRNFSNRYKTLQHHTPEDHSQHVNRRETVRSQTLQHDFLNGRNVMKKTQYSEVLYVFRSCVQQQPHTSVRMNN